jgi:hypothetical protein
MCPPKIFLSVREFGGNWRTKCRAVFVGVNETILRVYRKTVWRFENVLRLGVHHLPSALLFTVFG